MDQSSSGASSNAPPAVPENQINIPKIKALLQAKDDTQRFVGLALLKTLLDNDLALREDGDAVQDLWASISVKFLDRLIRTGSKPSNKDAKDMLDLSVTVLHTFAALLPGQALQEARLTGRIPLLVTSALHTYVPAHRHLEPSN